jgi:hypothetical protein
VQCPVSAVCWLYSRDSALIVLVHACGPFRCGDYESGVSGFDLGVWQQHHSLAGGWWGGAIRTLAALARLCGRGRRRLDR